MTNIFKKSSKFLNTKRTCFFVSFFLILLLPFFASAQTIFFNSPNIRVQKNTNFFLPLKINSVNNLFAISFDLNFDSSLIDYVSTTEGNFLSQGCNTSLLVSLSSPGKLIFGLTRLGTSCGGVSGAGTIATLNFRSLNQDGISNLTFSNNSHCLLRGASCNYVTGTWTGATVTIGTPGTTPPSVPTNLTASSDSPYHVNLSWSAPSNNGITSYKIYRNGQATREAWYSTSYFDYGVSPSTTYVYTVSSFGASRNESPQSAPVSVTTQAVPDTMPPFMWNGQMSRYGWQ